MPEFIYVTTEQDYAAAAILFNEYAGWLKIDLCFQHFSEELQQLATMYAPPSGGIILAKTENEFIGCVGIRKIETGIAELKRMYVKPAFHKRGIGKMLLEKALSLATTYNYEKIRLDTLSNMIPAISLYKQYGFYEIPAYYHNPEKTVVYFEKQL